MPDTIARILLIIAPLYFANACALLFAGKKPVDFGVKWFDGRPLLGPGKTFRGTAAGLVAGALVTGIAALVFPAYTLLLTPHYVAAGILLTTGAILGDMAASFLKRRLKWGRGQSFPVLDQLDFVAGGLIAMIPVFTPKTEEIIAIGILTLFVHLGTNKLAYHLKLKSVPW